MQETKQEADLDFFKKESHTITEETDNDDFFSKSIRTLLWILLTAFVGVGIFGVFCDTKLPERREISNALNKSGFTELFQKYHIKQISRYGTNKDFLGELVALPILC